MFEHFENSELHVVIYSIVFYGNLMGNQCNILREGEM